MGPRLRPKRNQTPVPIENIELSDDTQRSDELLNRLTTLTEPESRIRYKVLKGFAFIPARVIDWNSLQVLGLDDEIPTLLQGAGLLEFSEINEIAFRECTLEFLSTFKIDAAIKDPADSKKYKFRLMGIDMSISLNSLNVYLGVVSSKDVVKPEFQSRLRDFDPKFKAKSFWTELTGQKEYNASDSKSTFLQTHSMRFIQRYLASSLFARYSQSNMPKNDLFVVWCMLNKKPINVGHWLATYLNSQESTTSKYICAGPFITKLAKTMGIFNPQIHTLTFACKMEKFDCAAMGKLGICSKAGNTWNLKALEPRSAATTVKRKQDESALPESSVPASKRHLFTDAHFVPDAADVTMRQVMGYLAQLFDKNKELEEKTKQQDKEISLLRRLCMVQPISMIRPKSPEKAGGEVSCQSASSKPRKEKNSGKMVMVEEQPEKTKSDSEKLSEEIEEALRCAEGEVKRAEEVFQADLNVKQPEENSEEDPEEEQEEE
ncbi:hypothetical protein M5689_003342 [Euphorbia peplus]|nr:hypothetical protein M5689_003342 [Euphorbia peplus]